MTALTLDVQHVARPDIDDATTRHFARVTGVTYLAIAVCGVFAIGYVPSQLVVAGDPAATLAGIAHRQGLFKLGVAADVAVMLLEIIAATLLFYMFRPISAVAATGAFVARLLTVATMAAMLFFQAGLLALAQSAMPLDPAQMAVAESLLAMHEAGVWIWQVFFFAHLAILGRLVQWSDRFPDALGIAMTVGALGYLLDSVYSFGFPEADWLGVSRVGFLVLVTLAELGFALFLTVKAPAAPRL